jgi:cellulose binding protein with CBM2 domain
LARPLALAAAALLGTGFAFVAARQAGAAAGCSVTYAVTNQWSTGFTVQGVTVTNLGSPLTSWTLTWTFPGNQQVSNGWNGTFTQAGQQVTVASASYNGSLGTGASASPAPGFNGTFSGSNADPTSFSLNGTPCTGSTTPTPTPSTSPSTSPPPTPTPTPSGPPTPTSPTRSRARPRSSTPSS